MGASAVFALGVLLFTTIVVSALVEFTKVNLKAVESYQHVRTDRYAGDGAIKAAVNWAKDNPNVAVNPAYYPVVDGKDANAQCVYQVDDPAIGPVTASCHTDPTSNSGIPAQQGLVPPEAMLLLGARHNEPGPYSTNGCTNSTVSQVIADVMNFVGGVETPWKGSSEKSMTVNPVKRRNGLGNCVDFSREFNAFGVRGDVIAAGKVNVGSGILNVFNTDPTKSGKITARYGCDNPSKIKRMLGDTGTTGCDAWNATATHGVANVPLDSDPGRKTTDKLTPIGDIDDAYLPVGFNADGTARSGSVVRTLRSTAYHYVPGYVDADTSVPLGLKPLTTCVGLPSNVAIIFLPGWYKDVQVLNRYTANQNCADRTIWFAPDAGADRTLLTGDDQTGPFYLDFSAAAYTGPTNLTTAVGGVKAQCGGLATVIRTRWCIGATSTSEERVVVGTPTGWSPLGSSTPADPGGGNGDNPSYGGRVNVVLSKAGTVDDVDAADWLRFLLGGPWTNLNRATTLGDNGGTGSDAGYATYRPCKIEFFNIFTIRCPSLGTRTIRLAEFSPKATSAPLGDDTNPAGRIKIEMEYGLNTAAVSSPQVQKPVLEIETIDNLGRTRFCGSYEIGEKAAHLWEPGNPAAMPVSSISEADEIRLAQTCGAKEDINSYRVYLKVGGNRANSGDPRVYLGGVRVSFDSYMGARFPYPATDAPTPDARSDCDQDAEAGGQLIFAGDSHLYVADGSLEVCAGVYPGGPAQAATHQVIGIYGVPANRSLKVQSFRSPQLNGDNTSALGTWTASPRLNIGDPTVAPVEGHWNDQPAAQRNTILGFQFGKDCGFGFCDPLYGRADINVKMEPFTVPSGYKVQKVAARASFRNDSSGNERFCTKGAIVAALTSDCNGISDGLRMPDGNVSQAAYLSKVWTQNAERPEFVLYEDGGVNRMGGDWSTKLQNGAEMSWEGRIPCVEVLGVPTCVGRSIDLLDGIELDVTIAPNSTTEPVLRPQSGCIVAHPNYSGGAGDPDCAVVRANLWNHETSADISLACTVWAATCDDKLRGDWNGRVSVKGTIYAPSAAFEVDDQDVAYPLATRGLILRNLTASGWRVRPGYTGISVTNDIDRTPAARVTKFTACTQTPARRGTPCDVGQGDKILTEAGVSFVVPTGGTEANVPSINWWSTRRGGT